MSFADFVFFFFAGALGGELPSLQGEDVAQVVVDDVHLKMLGYKRHPAERNVCILEHRDDRECSPDDG